MNAADAPGFAADWVAAWNRRDLDALLAHFADDVVFTSPKAKIVVGEGSLRGKERLRAYWTAALARVARLVFSLDRVTWDEAARTLVIVYVGERDAEKTRCAEILRFGAHGLVIDGEAFYGVPV
jgi:steroid delta-isomerase